MDIAALYGRLSKEDYDKLNVGDDSASIQNQKSMLVDFAMENNMVVYKIYSDDDYSGADKLRPQWNKMLQDAKNGEFNTIICKTQSRFTREMEIVEKYIHGLFVEWGIRFIGVVDNVDTNVKGNKKSRQINGLVNEWYIEDSSDNIKSVFQLKMKNGEFLGSFAPYGYQKNPQDTHKLIIDDEAADIVRLIFDLSSQGFGVDIISQKLSALNIPTPTMYKQSKGLNFKNPNMNYTKNGMWSTTTLKRILNNQAYIGTLIQGREKKVSYKSKKIVIAPKEEWIIIENNHEPIITEEVFYKTQDLLKLRRKTCKTTEGKKFSPHLFSGRIKCLDCESTMAKTSGRLAGGHDYFICQLAKKSKLKDCSRHSIRFDELKEYVEFRLRNLIDLYTQDKDEFIKQHLKKSDLTKSLSNLKIKLIKLNNDIEDMKRSISTLYIDKVKGVITEDEFITIKSTLQEDINKMQIEEQKMKDEISIIENKSKVEKSFTYYLEKYKNFTELTLEMVNNLIIFIKVGEAPEDNTIKRVIDIKWNI